MAEFTVRATQLEFCHGKLPILKLEGLSVYETGFNGVELSVREYDSTIYLTTKQLGLTNLDDEMRFKVTVERID